MIRIIAALLFLFIGSVGAQAQTGWEYLDDSPERLIGLLDIPDIVGTGCDLKARRATARVFNTASQNGRQLGTLYFHDEGNAGCRLVIERVDGTKEDVPTLESDYEIGAAIVYEHRSSWYRIRLPRGSGWIRRDDSNDFLSYPDVLRKRLAYILEGWDGTLRDAPGTSGTIRPLPSEWKAQLDREVDIEYLGSRRAGNDLWIHVQFVIERCGQTVEGVPQAVMGWIPAYRSNRSPNVWFHSRGC